MRKLTLVTLFFAALPALGQTINCPSGFASTGACGVNSSSFHINGNGGANLSGSTVILQPTGVVHDPNSLIYQTVVNVQAFTATFEFTPNNDNLAFVIQNSNNNSGYDEGAFVSGAGCEAGFYQAFNTLPVTPPNNVLALEFDTTSALTSTGSFTYSSVQLYQPTQSPCNPNDSGPNYWPTTKLSTSPVPLNNPATTQASPSTDTFSVTLGYDGTGLNLCMYDVTAANGSCSSGTSGTGIYFQQTWTAVSIPAIVDGNTAYVGFTAATGEASTAPLNLYNFVYTVGSAPATPSLTTYTSSAAMGGTAVTANPSASPAGGSYSGAQTITLTDSTANSYICYTTSTTTPSIMPYPDNQGACMNGTLYSGSFSLTPPMNLYYVAGVPYTASSSLGLPSNVIESVYTSGGTATVPSCTPTSGTVPQTVTCTNPNSGTTVLCSAANPTTPATNGSGTGCATGTQYTGTLTVSSAETLNVIAGIAGGSDSSVVSYTYTASAVGVAAISGGGINGGGVN